MIIGQIKNGIVIDHISAGKGMYIYNVLGLDKLDCTVAMIKNADSTKMGKKDIIKIGEIIELDFDLLGFIDHGITVNMIEDGKLKIKAFYPMNLMQKLSLQKEYVEDWKQLVESVMIDWNYDGAVMTPAVTDVPSKDEFVAGEYTVPSDAGVSNFLKKFLGGKKK